MVGARKYRCIDNINDLSPEELDIIDEFLEGRAIDIRSWLYHLKNKNCCLYICNEDIKIWDNSMCEIVLPHLFVPLTLGELFFCFFKGILYFNFICMCMA